MVPADIPGMKGLTSWRALAIYGEETIFSMHA